MQKNISQRMSSHRELPLIVDHQCNLSTTRMCYQIETLLRGTFHSFAKAAHARHREFSLQLIIDRRRLFTTELK